MTIWLLLLSIFWQEDFSTPEKTLASYLAAREKFASGSGDVLAEWDQLSQELEGPLCTNGLKKRRQDNAQRTTLSRQRYVSHSVLERKEGAGGVTLVVEEKYRTTRRNSATGKDEEVEETRPKQLVFARVGDRWLVQNEFDACLSCRGKGTCFACGGSGEKSGKPCMICDGKKTCGACAGARWKERSFQNLGRIGLLDGFKRRTDTSSARAAAEAYADALVEEQIRIGARLKSLFEAGQAILKTYFVEAAVKASEEALRKALEEGGKEMREYVAKVLEIREDAAQAAAVIAAPPSPFGAVGSKRLVLQQSGGRWLVDDVQSPCRWCRGSGACSGCQGKPLDFKCLQCSGSRKCNTCGGSGYHSDVK